MTPLPRTLWLTGLSASGKSTLAEALEEKLRAAAIPCRVLDGDVVRRELSADLGFSREDRRENIRRVAVLCQQLNQQGIFVIAALISPYREDRALAASTIGEARFVEVHMAASLQVCEARDPKGLYGKARSGQLPFFTGVSDPYEEPEQPALRLDSGRQSLQECLDRCWAYLELK